jgi:hypothetical protein
LSSQARRHSQTHALVSGILLELAHPGGLFIFIVQLEILKTFLKHYSAHNSTSSMCNYIIQIKCFITKYWECHSAIIMDQLDHIGHGITHKQMQNKVAICCTYLSNNHRAGKRQLTGERYIAQGEREKFNNVKLPDMAGYCRNRKQVPIAVTGIHLQELFGKDNDDNNLWEGIDRDPTRSINDRAKMPARYAIMADEQKMSARYASYTLDDCCPQTLQNTNARKRESEIFPFNMLAKKPKKSLWTSDGNHQTPAWLRKKGFGVNRR